jgi:hypothetical protein
MRRLGLTHVIGTFRELKRVAIRMRRYGLTRRGALLYSSASPSSFLSRSRPVGGGD